MNRKPPDKVLNNLVATWLNRGDYEKLKALAKASNVGLSTYLRSIIVDAIVEETEMAIRPPLRDGIRECR